MNDAMTNILIGKIKRLNLRRNFSMGNSATALKTGEGASNQLQGSREFDAPHPLH
jgi:hypothetical protein